MLWDIIERKQSICKKNHLQKFLKEIGLELSFEKWKLSVWITRRQLVFQWKKIKNKETKIPHRDGFTTQRSIIIRDFWIPLSWNTLSLAENKQWKSLFLHKIECFYSRVKFIWCPCLHLAESRVCMSKRLLSIWIS